MVLGSGHGTLLAPAHVLTRWTRLPSVGGGLRGEHGDLPLEMLLNFWKTPGIQAASREVRTGRPDGMLRSEPRDTPLTSGSHALVSGLGVQP